MTPAKILAVLSPVLLNADVDSQSKIELMLNTTITGIVVVFAILILLVFVIMIYSKITLALTKKPDSNSTAKKNNEVKKEVAKKEVPSAPLTASSSSVISGDIIAVIAAAVASMDASLTVKSVKRASTAQTGNSGRRKAWNMAGILENTRPF